MQFIEILQDAVTVRGAVRLSGEVVQVSEEFDILSKRDQVRRWGKPRYRQISAEEYDERGGDTREIPAEVLSAEEELAAKQTATEPENEAQEPEASTEASDDEFGALVGLNAEDTLGAAAQFDEETLTRFIEWEKDNQNRKSVLEPLGAGPDSE